MVESETCPSRLWRGVPHEGGKIGDIGKVLKCSSAPVLKWLSDKVIR